MPLIDRVVTDLTETGTSTLVGFPNFRAVLRTQYKNSWDISLFDSNQIAGYVVARRDDRPGLGYYTKNQLYVHEGMDDLFGAGVEVHPSFRKRGIGHSLLSIGVAIALQDHKQRGVEPFMLSAYGLGSREEFFRKFGFEVEYFDLGGVNPHKIGRYKKTNVPDISIRR